MELGAEGTIHPTQILNSSGRLKSGFAVAVGGNSYNSADLSIGSGTFASAGAVGLHFYYPVTFTFYEKPATVDPRIPGPPSGPSSSLPGELITIDVPITNDSSLPIETAVRLTIDTVTIDRPVSLEPGETKSVTFTFNAPSIIGTYTIIITVDPDEKTADINRLNNRATHSFTVRESTIDAGSQIIGPLVANPLETLNITIQAFNKGGKSASTQITLTAGGVTQSQNITLAGGEVRNVTFAVTAPARGTLSLVSDIDPNNRLPDIDRSNNRSTAALRVQYAAAEPVSNCSNATITWSETESHTYTVPVTIYRTVTDTVTGSGSAPPAIRPYNSGGYSGALSRISYTVSGGRYTADYSGTVSGTFNETYSCNHVYDYKAELTADPVKFLYNDRAVHHMKSGYGFYLEAVTRISSGQTGSNGVCGTSRNRAHSQTVKPPTEVIYCAPATARPQTVTNRLGTQPVRVQLISNGGSPVTTYTTPANPISETRLRRIYTDPNWADRIHYFDMIYQGGGVAGKPWCYTRNGSFANNQYVDIKGNMYEDDYTGGVR